MHSKTHLEVKRCLASLLISAVAWVGATAAFAANRIVVDLTVGTDVQTRIGDERPASAILDFPVLAARAGLSGVVDIATLRLRRIGTDYDLPLRWDDDLLAGEFWTVEDVVDATTGSLKHEQVANAALLYNVATAPGSSKGRLVWSHRHHDQDATVYRLEAEVREDSASADAELPRAWIGDGVARFSGQPPNTTGSPHTRVDVIDWNFDGLPDIVYGENYGKLIVLINRGQTGRPGFSSGEFVRDTKGRALDAGISGAPLSTDWDGDGQEDLLVGTHWNRILFFRNVGTGAERRFEYRGVVSIDGKPLELPISPVSGRPGSAFSRDYYPMLERVDWNADGRVDLLAGGYLTGRIYLYLTTGENADGTPILHPQGPILADGEILNVGDWAAAPTAADLNGDGLFDLVSGNFAMSAEARMEFPLRVYMNIGKAGWPAFEEKPIRFTGTLPEGRLFSPRLADMDGDGLLDLVASSHAKIWWFRNCGTKESPVFEFHDDFIRPSQGNSPLPATQFIDWNDDGFVDLISNYTVRLNLREPDPFAFGPPKSILPEGTTIAHPSGIGDDWFHPRLFDFDGDNDYDVLFGDWHGQVWLHRNQGGQFNLPGRLLRLESGKPIKVGPGDDEAEGSFRRLQGARTVFTAASFLGDGRTDLVVGDTYGIVRFFKNVGTDVNPLYLKAQKIGDLGTRLSVDAIDWNNDGLPDIICGATNGRVRVFLNQANQPPETRFAAGIDPKLPRITQPRIIPADLNGDGDVDLFLPGTQGSFWIERSFVNRGYAIGRVTAVRSE